MKAKIHFYCKLLTYLLCRNTVPAEVIRNDYNRLSSTYDDHFSAHVGKHSRNLIEKMMLAEGGRVLDLACGTGTLTLAIAKTVGKNGTVVGVDSSPGMLAVAQGKAIAAGLENIRFITSDICDAIPGFDDNSLDAVTCGWAIGYVDPARLIATVSRKLKVGGKLGIIENARDTLAPVRKTAIRVAQTLPRHFSKVMDLHTRLPSGTDHLRNLIRCSKLAPVEIWEGREVFEFANGADVLNWVLHTGASAGFDTVMDRSVKAQCDELFVRFIEEDFMQDGRITVAHHFVAGIGSKARSFPLADFRASDATERVPPARETVFNASWRAMLRHGRTEKR